MYRSAGSIVEGIVATLPDSSACPKPSYLIRTANRARQSQRLPDPSDIAFDLIEDAMPDGFLQGDIRVGEARHLLFFTDQQLGVLKKAKTWYLDGTFKIIKKPFYQLFSIHAFVKGNTDKQKQVPLAFCFMSRRTKKDYRKILKVVKRKLDGSNVKEMVVDFEAGLWGAIRKVFLSVPIKGCLFHWTQAIWRNCQNLGLAVPFTKY